MTKKSGKRKRIEKLKKRQQKRKKLMPLGKISPKVKEEILLPEKEQTVAIAAKNKTAALCYDRIWSLSKRLIDCEQEDLVPKEIRCFGGTDVELNAVSWIDYISIFLKKLRRLTAHMRSSKDVNAAIKKYMRKPLPNYAGLDNLLPERLKDIPWDKAVKIFRSKFEPKIDRSIRDDYGGLILRSVAKSFAAKYGIPMATLFSTIDDRNEEYQEGNREAVCAVLSNIEIVDEDNVSWEQVLEFRKDKEVCNKYRRFLHWLDKEMVGKSQAFIEDEVSQKLQDYEQALKKHGIRTILGTIQETLDGKYLLGAAGAAAPFALAGDPVLGALAGAGLIVGKVVVKLIQTKLDFEDVERGPNSEISWVYETKKLGK